MYKKNFALIGMLTIVSTIHSNNIDSFLDQSDQALINLVQNNYDKFSSTDQILLKNKLIDSKKWIKPEYLVARKLIEMIIPLKQNIELLSDSNAILVQHKPYFIDLYAYLIYNIESKHATFKNHIKSILNEDYNCYLMNEANVYTQAAQSENNKLFALIVQASEHTVLTDKKSIRTFVLEKYKTLFHQTKQTLETILSPVLQQIFADNN